jgi:hypothetical protein
VRAARLLLTAALLAASARAQPVPFGPEIQANTTLEDFQSDPAVAADGSGRFAVIWTHACIPQSHFPCGDPSPDGSRSGVFGRWFDAAGQPVSPEVQVNEVAEDDQAEPDLAVGADGRFFAVWRSVSHIAGRFFDAAGTPLGPEIPITAPAPGPYDFAPAVAPFPGGGYVVIWRRNFVPGLWFRRLDADGKPLGPESRVEAGQFYVNESAVAAGDDGGFLVVWGTSSLGASEEDVTIRARRYLPSGQPAGPVFRVDVRRRAGQSPVLPAVAPRQGGGWLVAWQEYGPSGRFELRSRAVDPAGELGEIFPLAPSAGSRVALARDLHGGGFLVAWESWRPEPLVPSIAIRRLDPQGRPVGRDLAVTLAGLDPDLAPTPTGFALAWSGLDIRVRRLVASPPGADLCTFGPDQFLCDLLRDGGVAELFLPLGEPSDRPLLGDLDGDGRDDPCVFRSGHLLCDTSHFGRIDVDLSLQPGGGDPLLGDINGDGRDDLCLHSGRRFLCDTAHDGGTAELIIAFGRIGDLPLLGDLDGDGDDEPCVYRGNLLLCDIEHDGGDVELTFGFGIPGDRPLLGDVNGDGRDNLCLVRGNRILCDTAQEGAGPVLEIPFDPAAGEPLLGNVDGY